MYAVPGITPGITGITDLVIPALGQGKGLEGKIEKVELLGHTGALEFTQDADGLKVKFPAEKPCDFAYALIITGLKIKPVATTGAPAPVRLSTSEAAERERAGFPVCPLRHDFLFAPGRPPAQSARDVESIVDTEQPERALAQ